MCHSLQLRDQIFAKGFEFLSFAKTIAKNDCKKIIKKLIGKYIQKLLNYCKQSTTDAFKTFKKIHSKNNRSN